MYTLPPVETEQQISRMDSFTGYGFQYSTYDTVRINEDFILDPTTSFVNHDASIAGLQNDPLMQNTISQAMQASIYGYNLQISGNDLEQGQQCRAEDDYTSSFPTYSVNQMSEIRSELCSRQTSPSGNSAPTMEAERMLDITIEELRRKPKRREQNSLAQQTHRQRKDQMAREAICALQRLRTELNLTLKRSTELLRLNVTLTPGSGDG